MGGQSSKPSTFTVDHEQCMNTFMVYNKKTRHDGYTSVHTLRGVPAEPGHIHKHVDGNQFAKEPTEIPKGYRKRSNPTKEWMEEFACPKPMPSERLAALKSGGLEVDAWAKRSRKHWLTIQDVLNLEPGEAIKVLMLDRNVGDYISNRNKKAMLYKPAPFFAGNTALFRKTADLAGKLSLRGTTVPFEFDIEFKTDQWYPLTDGKLPARDSQGLFQLFGYERTWTSFSPKTHVGWRGAMIPWTEVSKLPNVYYL